MSEAEAGLQKQPLGLPGGSQAGNQDLIGNFHDSPEVTYMAAASDRR